MKHTNYKYKEMKVMINIIIHVFPVNIFLNKNTKKHPKM